MRLIARARAWLATAPAKARVIVASWPARAAAAVAVLTTLSVEVVPLLPGGWATKAAGYIAAALGAVAWVSAAVARLTPILFPAQKGVLPDISVPVSDAGRGWFHVADGLYFRRADDAGVVELGRGPDFDHVQVVQRIDASSWGSVVSNVSAQGEDYATFNHALGFHQADAAAPAPVNTPEPFLTDG